MVPRKHVYIGALVLICITFFVSRGITSSYYENILEAQKNESLRKIDSLARIADSVSVRVDTIFKRAESISESNKSMKNEIERKERTFAADTGYINNARVIAGEVERYYSQR